MNMEEIRKILKKNMERKLNADTLTDKIQDSEKGLEKEIDKNTDVNKLEKMAEKYANRNQMRRILNLFDEHLNNLISKKVTFESVDGDKIYMSYSGLACGEIGYWSKNANYIRTNRNVNSKWNDYKTCLRYYKGLQDMLFKKDKKKIMRICGEFSEKYTTFRQTVEYGFIEYQNPQDIQYIRRQSWRTPKFRTKTFTFDTVNFERHSNGIRINLKGRGKSSQTILIKDSISFEGSIMIVELMKNEKFKKKLNEVVNRFKAENEDKVKLIEEMEEKLQPFTVMELL